MQPPVETQSPRNLARYNIFTDPLFWTPRHLDAVGCRFEDHEALAMELPDNEHSSDGHQYLDQRSWLIEGSGLELNVERLARSCAPLVKYYALINILDCEESPFERLGKGTPFFFRRQAVHRPNYTLFCRRRQHCEPKYQHLQWAIGYFNYTDIIRRRRKKLQPRQNPTGGHNAVGQRLFHKRLSQITPLEWAHDPYLFCVLLSIAQLQRQSQDLHRQPAYISRLLVTNSSDVEFLHIYEAQITFELLEWLDHPVTSAEFTGAPIIVKRKKLPFKPFGNFVRRIAYELLANENARMMSA
ncbi:hypothetical protein BJX96DRAFT_169984 [Aspergillus floccosus]